MKLGPLNALYKMGQRNEDTEVTTVKSKLVVVGDCACGKTSMINRYVKGHFSEVSTFKPGPNPRSILDRSLKDPFISTHVSE